MGNCLPKKVLDSYAGDPIRTPILRKKNKVEPSENKTDDFFVIDEFYSPSLSNRTKQDLETDYGS